MSLKKNVVANFAGSAWAALMGLAFVPFYIRLMGVESYGIVGVYSSLMVVLSVLDLGLSQAMNREMARLSSEQKSAKLIADTARTLEILYWGVALVVGMVVALLATPIANYWLNPDQLTRGDLQQALWIMGLVIALRWPVSLYMGGLNGLQRQVQVNVLLSAVVTIQGVGALLVLWFVEPTIQAFFLWQAVMALVQVIVLRAALWSNLSHEQVGAFNKKIFNEIWRFAAGMSGISLLATILTQLDKILLSKLLPLSDFGYYTFAVTVAAVLYRLIGPIFTAYYPKLTELVAKKDQLGLVRTYHQGSQLMAVVIFPVAFTLAIFSKEILEIWTRDSDIVMHASVLVSLLTIGNLLNGLMNLPYALQLAHGRTRLAIYSNVVAVIVLAPAIYFATLRWGGIGAAVVWIGLNVGYLLIGMHIMYRTLLPTEKWRWYLDSVIFPALGAIGMGMLFEYITPTLSSRLGGLIFLMGVVVAMVASTALATPYFRNILVAKSKYWVLMK